MTRTGIPVVVLDTNILFSDVEATGAKLRAVLDGAISGDFDLIVPSVVIDELAKQYPARIKKAAKVINAAVGDQSDELRRLGVERPATFAPARDSDAYRERLSARLLHHGAQIRDVPADVRVLVDWALNRRKPFKLNGEGAQDAAIWLTVLDIAVERAPRRILFVSENVNDFGDRGEPVALAPDLRQDVVDRELHEDQVRLVTSLDRFLTVIATPLAAADKRAERIVHEQPTAGRIQGAVEEVLDFRRVDASVLKLGMALEEDPQIDSYDILGFQLLAAAEVDDLLRLTLQVEATIAVEAPVHRAEAYPALEDAPVEVLDWDYNEQYLLVGAEIGVLIEVEVLTDLAAESPEVEIVAVGLTPLERVRRYFGGELKEDLLAALNRPGETGGSRDVENYIPDAPPQSDLESATIDEIRSISIRQVDIDDTLDDETFAVRLQLDAECDVDWYVTAVQGADIERAESVEHGGGIIQDYDSSAPLKIEVTATLTRGTELTELEIELIELQPLEVDRRRARRDDDDPVLLADIEWAENRIALEESARRDAGPAPEDNAPRPGE